jgi:exodeoxyribonuclease V alpha subunit
VDNFEDNCVENEQNRMIQAWIKSICRAPFTQESFDEGAEQLIASIFDAQQRGDSCIDVSPEDIKLLKDLVKSATEVQQLQQHYQAAPFVYTKPYLYLYRYWALEHAIAQHVVRLATQRITPVELTAQHKALLSDAYQAEALQLVSKQAFSLVTGGPGTGKTYTLARIIAVLDQEITDLRIAMAAPTGKAAQRMKEALMASIQDPALAAYDIKNQVLNPVTLHRLLGLGQKGIAKFNERQPLPYDLIVVDEASMLDLNLAKMLFAAVPKGCRLILLGDAQQLASVDVGSVLADLQQIPALKANHVHLQNSRRFSDDAKIGQMARFIQNNASEHQVLPRFEAEVVEASVIRTIDLATVLTDLIQLEYLPTADELKSANDYGQYYDQLTLGFNDFIAALKTHGEEGFDQYVNSVLQAFDRYRILSAVRHGALGLTQLNEQIEQRVLQATQQFKKGEWYIGRPVMMSYNDYQLGLSNGDIGLCFWSSRMGQAQFEVYFPSLDKWVPATRLPKNIETAFALTIHKSQGSEFAHTAVVLEASAKELLSKELIYTAITRAKKAVSLLVDRTSFAQAMTRKTTRASGLAQQINQIFDE